MQENRKMPNMEFLPPMKPFNWSQIDHEYGEELEAAVKAKERVMATIAQKLKPFMVPNYVLCEMPAGKREDGIREAPKFHLRDIPEETLLEMCEDFKATVLLVHRSEKIT